MNNSVVIAAFFVSSLAIVGVYLQKAILLNLKAKKNRRQTIEEKKREILERQKQKQAKELRENSSPEKDFEYSEKEQKADQEELEEMKAAVQQEIFDAEGEYSKREIDQQIAKFFKKADSLLARGDEREAEKIFIRILAIDAEHLGANTRLALMYLERGEYKKSETLHKTLTELKPRDPAIHTNLGLALFYQNKYEEAILHFKAAVQLNPSRAGRYSNLGKVYVANGDTESARDCFHEAVRLDLRNVEYLFLLAEAEKELKNFGEAKEIYEHILKLEPFNEEANKEFESLKLLGF
jgi:Tfp pilus assembly protein PilF